MEPAGVLLFPWEGLGMPTRNQSFGFPFFAIGKRHLRSF